MSEENSATQVEQTNSESSVAESNAFASQAEEQAPSIVAEFIEFLVYNKKWWLAPIIIVLLLLGIFVFLLGTPLAPFIYPGL